MPIPNNPKINNLERLPAGMRKESLQSIASQLNAPENKPSMISKRKLSRKTLSSPDMRQDLSQPQGQAIFKAYIDEQKHQERDHKNIPVFLQGNLSQEDLYRFLAPLEFLNQAHNLKKHLTRVFENSPEEFSDVLRSSGIDMIYDDAIKALKLPALPDKTLKRGEIETIKMTYPDNPELAVDYSIKMRTLDSYAIQMKREMQSILQKNNPDHVITIEVKSGKNDPIVKITSEGQSICARRLPISRQDIDYGVSCQDVRNRAQDRHLDTLQVDQFIAINVPSLSATSNAEVIFIEFVEFGAQCLSDRYQHLHQSLDENERDVAVLRQFLDDFDKILPLLINQTENQIYNTDLKPSNLFFKTMEANSPIFFGDAKAYILSPNPEIVPNINDYINQVSRSPSHCSREFVTLDRLQFENLVASTYELLMNQLPIVTNHQLNINQMLAVLQEKYGEDIQPLIRTISDYDKVEPTMLANAEPHYLQSLETAVHQVRESLTQRLEGPAPDQPTVRFTINPE